MPPTIERKRELKRKIREEKTVKNKYTDRTDSAIDRQPDKQDIQTADTQAGRQLDRYAVRLIY